MIYAVAELLGKFPHEVAELSPDELSGILAYVKLRNEKEKKAHDAAKAKAKSEQRGPRRRR